MSGAFQFSEKGATFYYNGQIHTVAPDHTQFEQIKMALVDGKYEDAVRMAVPITMVKDWLSQYTDFELRDALIFYQDEPFPAECSRMALEMVKIGYPSSAVVNFLKKLRQNPSYLVQKRALTFIRKNDMMLHEDGDILCFRGVRDDFYDWHTGNTFRYTPGAIISMPRHEVDDDPERECSRGIHFATKKFADGYGSRTMIIKTNPKDIVSIPTGYHAEKGRCCKVHVLAEVPRGRFTPKSVPVYSSSDFGVVATEPASEDEFDEFQDWDDWEEDDEMDDDWEDDDDDDDETDDDDDDLVLGKSDDVQEPTASEQLAGLNRDALRKLAKELNIEGRGRMSKAELLDAVRERKIAEGRKDHGIIS